MCTGCDPRSNSARTNFRVGVERAHASQVSASAHLVRHDVALSTARVSRRQKKRDISPLRLGECLRTPGPPVDRVAGVLLQIRRAHGPKAVYTEQGCTPSSPRSAHRDRSAPRDAADTSLYYAISWSESSFPIRPNSPDPRWIGGFLGTASRRGSSAGVGAAAPCMCRRASRLLTRSGVLVQRLVRVMGGGA